MIFSAGASAVSCFAHCHGQGWREPGEPALGSGPLVTARLGSSIWNLNPCILVASVRAVP
jgi:hypothetical protein